jgi:hypothetical protein
MVCSWCEKIFPKNHNIRSCSDFKNGKPSAKGQLNPKTIVIPEETTDVNIQEINHILKIENRQKFKKGFLDVCDKYDLDDKTVDSLINTFLYNKFKHWNGRVNIRHMQQIMTTDCIPNLFANDIKKKLRRELISILESFEADDGYIKE